MFLISAGHHPYAKGATYGDFTEFDEACIWQRKLCEYLGSRAVAVPHGKLWEKVHFINNQPDVECAVEIHFNSAQQLTNPNWSEDGEEPVYKHVGRGCETLIYPGSTVGRALGEAVQRKLSIIYEPNRGVKDGWYRMDQSNGPDFFLAKTRCTAIIVEPEFVQNAAKIQEARDAGCTMIADALLDYYGD
jgi:hypothetical protein